MIARRGLVLERRTWAGARPSNQALETPGVRDERHHPSGAGVCPGPEAAVRGTTAAVASIPADAEDQLFLRDRDLDVPR